MKFLQVFCLVTVTTFCLHEVVCAAVIPEESDNENLLRNLQALSNTEDQEDASDIDKPQKRSLSTHYLTSLRTQHLDQAAINRLLRQFMGKRNGAPSKRSGVELYQNEPQGEVDVTTEDDNDLFTYVIFAGKINKDNFLRELDSLERSQEPVE